jgi:hypothetical protein
MLESCLTDIPKVDPYFDVRQSVQGRNRTRHAIALLIYASLIWNGTEVLPEETVISFNVAAVKVSSVWSILGFVAIGHGIHGLLKELIFAVRAWSTTGEWHFRLTEHDLLWHVPDHVHGEEKGFVASLGDLKLIEFKTLHKDEKIGPREYWVHFHTRAPIQLKSFSGINLSGLVERLIAVGVPYVETHENSYRSWPESDSLHD